MSDLLEFDTVIIGGGIVGLAVADALSKKESVLLLERHNRLGTETTARNSEVIHAGIYYPAGTMKEKFCIEGRELLYRFAKDHGVDHRNCGKLVVAQDDSEISYLEKISSNCRRASVPFESWDAAKIRSAEPNVQAKHAIHSPTTGIVCSEDFTQKLENLCTQAGVTIAPSSSVTHWEPTQGGYVVHAVQGSSENIRVACKKIVNSAGLASMKIGEPVFKGKPPFQMKFIRGHYLSLSNRFKNHTSRLIYPVPDTKGGGLGIHLTLDLQGEARLGPDTDWRNPDTVDIQFHDRDFSELQEKFFNAGKKYLPLLTKNDVLPGFVGVRPKLVSLEGTQLGDFYISEESKLGFPGFINLIGIESPGLTSALAIAKHVATL